jgi:hypothetical protein
MAVNIQGDNSAASPGVVGGDTDTGVRMGTNELSLVTGGTNRVNVDSSGRVGVGTTSPGSLFELNAAVGTTAGISFGSVGDSITASRYIGICNATDQTDLSANSGFSGIEFGGPSSTNEGFLAFHSHDNGVASGERMRIDKSGRLLVGTTTPLLSAGHSLTISDNSGGGALVVSNTDGATASPACSFATANSSTSTSNFLVKFFVNGFGSGSGGITANGTSAAAFSAFSDKRLKENIVNLPSQWDNIKNLRPVEFDFKAGGHQIGFIAQEFENVYPDAVGSAPSEKDPDVEHLILTGWSKTEARLVKALQEAITKIETLETKVAALEGGN